MFWGEIAPCEHLVQIYENDGIVLDALEGFISGGLLSGDGVIVIATPTHLEALHDRLRLQGFDLASAQSRDQYIPLGVEETLSKFMVKGWPDSDRFERVVTQLLAQAGKGGRRVRAFGEMVAVLWGSGNKAATVRLEHLWHSMCQSRRFSLFCAYPGTGFSRDSAEAIREICLAHSRVIDGSVRN